MTEQTPKTMNDAVKEIKNNKVSNDNEKTLLDEFAMYALSGFLASNSAKDAARKSYILAQEMMEMRKQANKGKLKD